MIRLARVASVCVFMLSAFGGSTSLAQADNDKSPFVLILVDAKTEARFGEFPFSRAAYATAIDRLTENNAKAIAIRLFLDLPRDPAGDAALEAAMAKLKSPLILEATIRQDEASTAILEDRFLFDFADVTHLALRSSKGWLPLPRFQKYASAIGFVDSSDLRLVPMLENFQGRAVKSLYLTLLEAAYGPAVLSQDKHKFLFSSRMLDVNNEFQVPVEIDDLAKLEGYSLVDLLDGTIDRNRLQGHVVAIAYDGPKMPIVNAPQGPVRADRIMWNGLLAVDRLLRAHATTAPVSP